MYKLKNQDITIYFTLLCTLYIVYFCYNLFLTYKNKYKYSFCVMEFHTTQSLLLLLLSYFAVHILSGFVPFWNN